MKVVFFVKSRMLVGKSVKDVGGEVLLWFFSESFQVPTSFSNIERD